MYCIVDLSSEFFARSKLQCFLKSYFVFYLANNFSMLKVHPRCKFQIKWVKEPWRTAVQIGRAVYNLLGSFIWIRPSGQTLSRVQEHCQTFIFYRTLGYESCGNGIVVVFFFWEKSAACSYLFFYLMFLTRFGQSLKCSRTKICGWAG